MRTGDVEGNLMSKWILPLSLSLPVLVSTRAGISQGSAPQKIARSKVARLTARVPLKPLSSWIGKELAGQNIPKHHLDVHHLGGLS
jgi:hypothetical protein